MWDAAEKTSPPKSGGLGALAEKGARTKDGSVEGVDTPSGGGSVTGEKEPELPMVKKVSYGAVSFATLSLGLLVNAYGYDFYVQLGALLPVLSLFTALARSCDIATDMCMAWFSDNARTPYGRRRPFMALGCIPYGVLFFLFFTPPTTLGPIEVSFYFGIFYILFYLSDTVSTVPYDALGPELTSDYDERNTVFFVARLFQISGSVTASILPAVLQSVLVARGWSSGASQRFSLAMTAAFFATWYIVAMFNCVFSIKERPPPADQDETIKAPLVPSIIRSFRNPAIQSLILAWVMDGLQIAMLITLFPFYIRYYIKPSTSTSFPLNPTTMIGLNITLLFLAAAITTPVWLLIAKRFGKFNAWITYNVVSAVTTLLLLAPQPGQNVLVMVVMFLNGIPGGGGFLNNSIMADVVDYEELLHGVRSEGTFSVYNTLVNKTVAIPGSAIPLGILSMLGFVYPINGVDQTQPTAVINFLFYGLTVFTFACSVVGALAKMRFPLRTPKILLEIQEGVGTLAAGGDVLDPITGAPLRRPMLDKDEQRVRWMLENFDPEVRRCVLEDADARPLQRRMIYWVVFSSLLSVALGAAAVAALFYLLGDPTLSVAATLAVIATTFSLCWTGICARGLVDAIRLNEMDGKRAQRVVQQLDSTYGAKGGKQAGDPP